MKSIDVLQDGKSQLALVDSMGSDLSIVNDARASFDRMSESLTEKDVKLIRYLLSHQPPHMSPFRGVVFKFKVKAPLFICRQWWKHVIASNHNDEQLGWNERSFRYTATEDSSDFYVPAHFRLQSKSNKQGSEGLLSAEENDRARAIYETQCRLSYNAYRELLDIGVCREEARAVLDPAFYTSWVWTVSLQALMNFLELRLVGEGAQGQITAYATHLLPFAEEVVPATMEIWRAINGVNSNPE